MALLAYALHYFFWLGLRKVLPQNALGDFLGLGIFIGRHQISVFIIQLETGIFVSLNLAGICEKIGTLT